MKKKNGFMKYPDWGQAPLLSSVKENFHFLLCRFHRLPNRIMNNGTISDILNQYSIATGLPSL